MINIQLNVWQLALISPVYRLLFKWFLLRYCLQNLLLFSSNKVLLLLPLRIMHNKYLDHLFALAFQLCAEIFRKSHVSLSVRQIRSSQRSYEAVCVCGGWMQHMWMRVHGCVGGQHAYGSKAKALKTSAEFLFYSYGGLRNYIRHLIDLLFRK